MIFKLGQLGRIREATFAVKRSPEIFWTSEPPGSANTQLLVTKVHGSKSALLEILNSPPT
jgi:hypothetical protein